MAEYSLDVLRWVADATNPPGLGWTTTDLTPYKIFDGGGGNEAMYCAFRLPKDFSSSPILKVLWTNSTTNTGNVIWQLQVSKGTPNSFTEDMLAARTYGTTNKSAADAGVATRRLQWVDITLTNFDSAVAEDWMTFKFFRDSTDASDSLTEDCYVFDLKLDYTAT